MADSSQYGAFIQTTAIFDISMLYQMDVNTPEFKDFLVRLYQTVNNIALLLNIKDSGFYVLDEFVSGQQLFPNPALDSSTELTPTMRPIYRKVINFGALPAAASKSVAHELDINASWSFLRIEGIAFNPTAVPGTSLALPIPYVDAANYISLNVTDTNVVMDSGTDYSAYTVSYVILEYVKN